ncbi:MAG: adenosine-specific kinase [Candidatus Freyarchaeum deiterrae]
MAQDIKIITLDIEKEKDDQFICGMANFSIYTVDYLFREIVAAAPGIKFGVAMNEAVPKLVRFNGNDDRLAKLAAKNALAIGASHAFVILMTNAYPIHVLGALKNVATVCNITVASANPVQIILAETSLGRAILGAVDGQKVTAIENEKQRQERRDLVKKLGYLLG